jgi:putative ABC transport system permease protein
VWIDLHIAARGLRRRWGPYLVAYLNLSAGLSACLLSFTLIEFMQFGTARYRDVDRVVMIWEDNTARGVGLTPISLPNYRDLAASSRSLEVLGALTGTVQTLDRRDYSTKVQAYQVSADLLPKLGTNPALGRVLQADDGKPGAPNVAVLSHEIWVQEFGARANVVGEQVRITGESFTVVGVMPNGFTVPPSFEARLVNTDAKVPRGELWMPLRPTPQQERRDYRGFFAIGRLRPDVAPEDVRSELSVIGKQLAAAYPDQDRSLGFAIVPLKQQVVERIRPWLLTAVAVGLLVLIIACANALQLMTREVVRDAPRRRTQQALGCPTWRLAVPTVVHAVVVGWTACFSALALTTFIWRVIQASVMEILPSLGDASISWTVWMSVFVASTVTALGMGVIPYVRLGISRHRFALTKQLARYGALASQVAIATALLAVGGSLFAAGRYLRAVPSGLADQGVTVAEVLLPQTRYADVTTRARFGRGVLASDARNASLAVVDRVPFGESTVVGNWTLEGRVDTDPLQQPRAVVRSVSSAYFTVLGIPLVTGRLFADSGEDATVAVVNEEFARRFSEGLGIVGRRLKRGALTSAFPWITIVGLVRSTRSGGLDLSPQPEVFVPFEQGRVEQTVYVVGKAPPGVATGDVLRRSIRHADSDLQPATVMPLSTLIDATSTRPLLYAAFVNAMGAIALFVLMLSAIGVGASMSGVRTDEFRVRLTLGATGSDIVRLILVESGLTLVLATAGAVALTVVGNRYLRTVLPAVPAPDFTIFMVSAWTVLGLTVAGLIVPVLRAIKTTELLAGNLRIATRR